MSDIGSALGTDLSPLPVPKPKKVKDTVAKPAAAPPLSMGTAAQDLKKANTAETTAATDVAAAEGKAATAKGGLEQQQNEYIEGLRNKETAELAPLDPGPFKPDQNTLGNMAGLFTMVGMLGAFMGGKGTSSAGANAQAALTGMMKGWTEGNDEVVREQKAIFDTNAQYLRDKATQVREIYKEYEEDALKFGIPTAQGRLQQRLVTEAEADVNAERVKLSGAQAASKQAESIFKMAEAFDTKRMTLQAEQNRQAEALQMRLALARMSQGRQEQSVLPPDAVDEMVDQYLAGDKSVATGFGYGAAGQQNRKLFREALSAKMKAQGLNAQDIVHAQAELAGTMAGERALGTQSGRVQGAIGALQETVPLALQASQAVDRTQFPKLNDVENAVRQGTGDTGIVIFHAYNQAVVNDYTQIMKRGGASTDESARRANDILSTSFSNGQYAAGIEALNAEASAVQSGLRRAKDVVAGKHESTSDRPQPTAADREWVKKHPESREKFVQHFGVEP